MRFTLCLVLIGLGALIVFTDALPRPLTANVKLHVSINSGNEEASGPKEPACCQFGCLHGDCLPDITKPPTHPTNNPNDNNPSDLGPKEPACCQFGCKHGDCRSDITKPTHPTNNPNDNNPSDLEPMKASRNRNSTSSIATPGLPPNSQITPIDGGKVLQGEKLRKEMKRICTEHQQKSKEANETYIVLKVPEQQNKTMNVPCSKVEGKHSSRFLGWVIGGILGGILG